MTLTELDSEGVVSEMYVNSTNVVIPDLHPFYTYYYTVAASTTLIGPSSDLMPITMPEDG